MAYDDYSIYYAIKTPYNKSYLCTFPYATLNIKSLGTKKKGYLITGVKNTKPALFTHISLLAKGLDEGPATALQRQLQFGKIVTSLHSMCISHVLPGIKMPGTDVLPGISSSRKAKEQIHFQEDFRFLHILLFSPFNSCSLCTLGASSLALHTRNLKQVFQSQIQSIR